MPGSRRLAGAVLNLEARLRRAPHRRQWAAVAIWYGLIFMLSQAPGTDAVTTRGLLDLLALGDLNGLVRLFAHMVLFGVLAVLVYLALGDGPLERDTQRVLLALLLTAGLGAADEVHQRFVPNRFGRPVDAAYDVLGATVALGVSLGIVGWARRTAGSPPQLTSCSD